MHHVQDKSIVLQFVVYNITAMLRRYLILLITISVLPYLASATEKCSETAAGKIINRSQQIQTVAKYILNQLGYSQPPDAPSDSIPEDEVDNYHMQKYREQDECNSKGSDDAINVSTIKGKPMHLQSASESGSGSDSKRASGDHNIGGDVILASYDIEFGLEADGFHKHPRLVELMVYKKKSNCSNTQDNLFQLVEIIEKSNTSLGKVIAVQLIDVCSLKRYIGFDVTKAAIRWVQQRLKKVDLTLTVKCISSGQCDLRSENQVRFSTSSKQMKRPHLVVETYIKPKEPTSQNKRRKRNTSSRFPFCNNSTKLCCLKELKVDFQKDLGWNFVKLPKEIYVNYCEGLCPLGSSVTPPHFGLHSSSNPCCSGATYESLKMLIKNVNGTSELLELPKMTVTSCQCG